MRIGMRPAAGTKRAACSGEFLTEGGHRHRTPPPRTLFTPTFEKSSGGLAREGIGVGTPPRAPCARPRPLPTAAGRAAAPRVRPHCRFNKRGTDSLRGSGRKRISGGAEKDLLRLTLKCISLSVYLLAFAVSILKIRIAATVVCLEPSQSYNTASLQYIYHPDRHFPAACMTVLRLYASILSLY